MLALYSPTSLYSPTCLLPFSSPWLIQVVIGFLRILQAVHNFPHLLQNSLYSWLKHYLSLDTEHDELGTAMEIHISRYFIPINWPILKTMHFNSGHNSTFPGVLTEAYITWQGLEIRGKDPLKGKMRPTGTFWSLFSGKFQCVFSFALFAALYL